MMGRAGLLPGGADDLPDPAALIARALHSWNGSPGLFHAMGAANVTDLAHHLCGSLEAGGFPVTCLANGTVILASPDYEPGTLDEDRFWQNFNNLCGILRTLSEECAWMQDIIRDQHKLLIEVQKIMA